MMSNVQKILIILWSFSATVLSAIDDGNIISFELVEGMILVKGEVNGKIGEFIFDTGSSGLAIHSIEKNLKDGTVISTVDGISMAANTSIDKVSIDGFILSEIQSAINIDLSKVSRDTGRDIIGVIGWSLLTESLITIDYEQQRIIIGKSRGHCVVDYNQHHILKLNMRSIRDDLPTVEVYFRNQKLTFAFDTGAPLNIIDKDFVELGFANANSAFNDQIILDKNIHVRDNLFRVQDLEHFNEIDGILSVSGLNANKVIIDRGNSRIFVFWKKNMDIQ